MNMKSTIQTMCLIVFVSGFLPPSAAMAAVSDEEIALSLATLLRSARAVISKKQPGKPFGD